MELALWGIGVLVAGIVIAAAKRQGEAEADQNIEEARQQATHAHTAAAASALWSATLPFKDVREPLMAKWFPILRESVNRTGHVEPALFEEMNRECVREYLAWLPYDVELRSVRVDPPSGPLPTISMVDGQMYPTVEAADESLTVRLMLIPHSIECEVRNRGEGPVALVWDRCVLLSGAGEDVEGQPLWHTDVPVETIRASQAPALIPRHGKVASILLPLTADELRMGTRGSRLIFQPCLDQGALARPSASLVLAFQFPDGVVREYSFGFALAARPGRRVSTEL